MSTSTTPDLHSLRVNISWSIEEDLQRSLGPLIHIVGDKVRLRHQSYAELLRRGSHFTVLLDIHFHLLARCIEYLELIGGQ